VKLLRYSGIAFVLIGAICVASDLWYLADTKACTAHERLCVSAHMGIAYALFVLSIGVSCIPFGVAMIYEARNGRRRPRLYAALCLAGLGTGGVAFAIANLLTHNSAASTDVLRVSNPWPFLIAGIAYLAAAIKLFQRRS
jgi:hypothetical protein